MTRNSLAFVLVVVSVRAAQAQVCATPNTIGDPDAELLRSASLLGRTASTLGVVQRMSSLRLQGPRCFGPDSTQPPSARTHPAYQLELLPASLITTYNSAYPRDRNNGALWSGRGASSALSAGAFGRASILSAALSPVLVWSANASFPLALSYAGKYGAAWMTGIDLPQRFGDGSYDRLDLGASYVRLDAAGLALGVSNENLWWGPQRFFPLMMSNTAPGFPHLFLGTSRPVNIGLGRLEGEVIWGRLSESEFFDTDSTNDRRLFGGIVLGFEPRGLSGFTIGLSRAYHEIEPPGGFTISELLRAPYTQVRVNALGRDNNLLSVFARWAMSPTGFEVYGEWAREDHWQDGADLIRELDHSQAYALGVQRVLERGPFWYRVYGELAHLESGLSLRGGRGVVTFYQNTSVPQGHTQRGQLLGAWIGPGSDAQVLGIDRLRGAQELGFYLQRTRFNTDAYYTTMAPRYAGNDHDLELTGAVRYSGAWSGLRVNSELGLSRRWNRAFVDLVEGRANQAQWNVGLTLQAVWRP